MIVGMGGGHMMVRRGHRVQTPSPTPTPTPSPTAPPLYRGRYGDSHTDGRETELTAKTPFAAFDVMWDASYASATVDANSGNGQSGRSFAGSLTQCLSRTFAGTPWIHMQESGNQNLAGQTTSTAFGQTFYDGMLAIAEKWPGVFLTYETAYSFSDARKAQAYRNWDTYNTELRARVVALAGVGLTVRIVESEYYILQAVAALGYNTVCFPDADPNAYHFQGIGNFVIALAMFKRLGYDVTQLNHSGVNLNSTHKSTAIAIVSSS